MSSFVGGRGKKAPYETSVVRVPVPVLEEVEKIIQDYRHSLESDPPSSLHSSARQFPDKAIALSEAEKILRQKKSARLSLEKFIDCFWSK